MPLQQADPVSELYLRDETAWLEAMAELVAARRFDEIDSEHLTEYLTNMVRRDRREVFSRLVLVLCHLLKWRFEPDGRTASWRATVRELRQLLESSTLHNHALEVLSDAYQEARDQAADETGLNVAAFSNDCAWSLEAILGEDLDSLS